MPGYAFMMIIYNVIFSKHAAYRIGRHIVFWVIFSVWLLLPDMPNPITVLPYFLGHLFLAMLYAYIALYFLIPRYLLRRRYRAFIFNAVVLIILAPFFWFLDPVSYLLDPSTFYASRSILWDGIFDKKDLIMLKGLQLDSWTLIVFTIGLVSVIKLAKLYYLENVENKRLQAQKIHQELQLLKSQVNCRFLFDALNSIRSHVLNQSKASTDLLMKLADLLSYILYENDEKTVPLKKEISLIEWYLTLEKEGQGKKVDMRLTQQGEIGERQIIPLLLLPLVETCFENSTWLQKKGAGIFLDFNVQGLLLKVTLKINNLSNFNIDAFQKSINKKNIRRRLDSFYSERHLMKIVQDNQSYTVHLDLKL